MARVNIYLPDDLAEAIRHANQELNVSQICSAALRDALFAQHTIREPFELLDKIVTTSAPVGWDLAQACGLRYVIASGEPPSDQEGAGDPAWLRATEPGAGIAVEHLPDSGVDAGSEAGAHSWSASSAGGHRCATEA